MLDFCLLHYLLSSDSEAMTLHKCHHTIHYFSKLLAKNKLVISWIIFKVIPLWLGSAILAQPSDIGEYLSSLFNAVVAVVFYLYFYQKQSLLTWLLVFLITYLLTYFLTFTYLMLKHWNTRSNFSYHEVNINL